MLSSIIGQHYLILASFFVRHLVSAVFDRALMTPSSTPVTVSSSSSSAKTHTELPVTVSDAYLLIQV